MKVMATTQELVERGDLDELIRQVERLCAEQNWEGLLELRDRARQALERGRQLWPVASLAEYRLALRAPGPLAASVLHEGAGHFALGPLTEVAASTHEWSELAPHLDAGVSASLVAYERVVRGEDLSAEGAIDTRVFELPLRLERWEPRYPVATYEDDKSLFPTPTPRAFEPQPLPSRSVPRIEGGGENEALLELVRPWTTDSNGTAQIVAVEGNLLDAIAALADEPVHGALVEPGEGLSWMAWAGASGGAHGRRRGMATGRFNTWWAAAALCGMADDWPPPPSQLGDAIGELRWALWRPENQPTGWQFHLAVDDPADGLAWAIAASDQA
jgi:hypothetical protein